MSLIGTRPPTVDEWEKYELHHRANCSCVTFEIPYGLLAPKINTLFMSSTPFI